MLDAKQPPRPSFHAPTTAKSYYTELRKTLAALDLDKIELVADHLVDCFHQQRTVFMIGNGGSAATASHFACDLGKGTAGASPTGRRFRAHALTDNLPTMTAWANDSDYKEIFAEQLKNFSAPGDSLLAFSGSGNSPNILRAIETASDRGLTVVGLTGGFGGRMESRCDICLAVPSQNMQIIEDIHLSVAHSLYHIVSQRLAAPEIGRAVGAD